MKLAAELDRGADFHESAPKTVHTIEQSADVYTDAAESGQARKPRPTPEALDLADRYQKRIADLEWSEDAGREDHLP